METICLQCGDKGFENAFVYCIQCLQFAVHRYCLDKIPETFDEFVRWRCDDCEYEIQKKKRDITYLGAPAIPEEQGCKVDSSKEITEPPIKRRCENAKVARNSEEKCKGLVVVANNNRHEQGHLIHCSRQNLGPTEKCITDSVLEERGSLITSNTGSNSDGVASHLGRASSRVEEQGNIPAEPVEDPVWRGDFNIMNKAEGTYDGFVAHISNKACLRVYEEARLLNPLLHLEMFPKSDVWPKSFLKSEPSGESIALYFFPADLSSERVFDALVEEMMENELALKATSENAELLLFTSTELPILYWRFQGKMYLWGVFSSKQGSGSHQSKNSDNVVRALCSANDKDEVPERSPRMSSTIEAWSPVSPLSNGHTMDLSREPEADDSGLSHLKMNPQDAHKILERFTEDQLLEIVQFVISRDPIALNDVRSIADTDLARRKLHIRGLGSEITTERLRSIFAVFGEVAEANVITDRNTGKSKKYGFVTFKHIDGAVLALREPSKKIDGRIIVAQLAAAGNTWFRRVAKPPPGFGNQGQISFGRGYGGGLNNSGSSSINSLPSSSVGNYRGFGQTLPIGHRASGNGCG